MAGLEDDIRGGKIAPVYVFAEGERLLCDRVVQALTQAIVTPVSRAFNLDLIEGKGSTAQGIMNAARTIPMLGKQRLVVVRDAEGLGAESLAALAPYLAAPAPHAVVVLLFGKVDKRLKFFLAAKKAGCMHELAAPKQLVPWVEAEARRAGVTFAGGTARRLADVAGDDLSRLAMAIEQLALYAEEGRPVSVADVDVLVADTSEETVFQLTDAVGQGDRIGALKTVGKLTRQRESAIGVTLMLARHFRQLALFHHLVERRVSGGDMARELGVPPFVVDKIGVQARRLSSDAVAKAMRLLARADRDLKSGVKAALGEELVLERLVDALTNLGAPRGSAPDSSSAPRR